MFNQPIKRTLLTSIEEVKKYSYLMNETSLSKMVYFQNERQIAFVDENGNKYVTPYRREIPKILANAGYEKGPLYVPFSNGGEVPKSYQWLKVIANQENWAETHEKAFEIAQSRDIKPVTLSSEEKIHKAEISYYNDEENHIRYSAMVSIFFSNEEKNNIGTYIIVNKKTLVVCDEYGRTFLIRVKSVINDIVNALIDAGYRHNATPEKYVSFYKPEKPLKEPELPVDAIV